MYYALPKKWVKICETEEVVVVNSPSHEEDFDDVGCNADLEVVTSDHNNNNRIIPIVFSRLVLTKS